MMDFNSINFKTTALLISKKYKVSLETAEDIMQENAIKALSHYDKNLGSLKTFFYANTKRELFDLKIKPLSNKIKLLAIKNLDYLKKEITEETPEALLQEKELEFNRRKKLIYAFNKLKEEQKNYIIDFYVKEIHPKDSGLSLGINETAMRERIKYAVRNLREKYFYAEENWDLLSLDLKMNLGNTLAEAIIQSMKQKEI